MIALLDMAAGALIPLVWSTSVEFGGLSMSPASIGLWMAVYGTMNCVVQFVAFPRIVERFGPRRVFIACIILFFPVFIMLPLENLALRHSIRGLNLAAGLLIMLQLSAISFSDMGFGKFPRTLHCVRSLKWCGSIRRDVYVHILCCPQQAFSRRYEWSRADDGLDSAHGRTSCCRITVCIFTGQQHLGGKLCVRRAARPCVGWAGRRYAASEEHVETYCYKFMKKGSSKSDALTPILAKFM